MKIVIPFKTPTIKCKNCEGFLKPAGPNKVIGKDKKYCGKRFPQGKRKLGMDNWKKHFRLIQELKEAYSKSDT